MARFPLPWPGRRFSLNINGIYIIVALLVVTAIIAFIFGRNPFVGKGQVPVPASPEHFAAASEILPESVPGELAPEGLVESNFEVETPQGVVTLAAETKPEPNITSLATETKIQPDPRVTELVAQAMALVNSQPTAVIEARDRLNDVLLICRDAKQRDFIKEQLSKLSEQWLFSKSLFPNDKLCASYNVKKGDQLRIIGQRHKVPYEILAQINNIRNPQALQAGQTIKVINGPFNAKVIRSTFTIDVYLQKTFVCSFPVGLGMPGKETPVGIWRVKKDGKMEKPVWTDPDTQRVYRPTDPDYPLGSRWIELEGMEGPAKDRTGFGIHGTKDPQTIGAAQSRGCIRLHNGNAVLVYNLLVPIYSQVRIEE
jgi:lipoprotein-anchoring transpeptidase ErfK/SrfK